MSVYKSENSCKKNGSTDENPAHYYAPEISDSESFVTNQGYIADKKHQTDNENHRDGKIGKVLGKFNKHIE